MRSGPAIFASRALRPVLESACPPRWNSIHPRPFQYPFEERPSVLIQVAVHDSRFTHRADVFAQTIEHQGLSGKRRKTAMLIKALPAVVLGLNDNRADP